MLFSADVKMGDSSVLIAIDASDRETAQKGLDAYLEGIGTETSCERLSPTHADIFVTEAGSIFLNSDDPEHIGYIA